LDRGRGEGRGKGVCGGGLAVFSGGTAFAVSISSQTMSKNIMQRAERQSKMKKEKNAAIGLLCVGAVVALAGTAFGSVGGYVDPNSGLGSNTFDTGDALKSLARAVLLIVIIGAAAIYVTKKVMPKVNAAMGKEMKVIESLTLGSRRQLYIVKVGTKKLLVGASADSIRFLADVSDAVKEGAKDE
jgi:hypothetical protein